MRHDTSRAAGRPSPSRSMRPTSKSPTAAETRDFFSSLLDRTAARAPLLGRESEEMPAGPVLDLDEPEIGVEPQLAPHALFDVGGGNVGDDRREQAFAASFLNERLRRRAVEARRAVESVDLDEDRTRFGRAAPPQHRVDAFDGAAAQMRGDPEIRAEAAQARPAIRSACRPGRKARGSCAI